VGVPAVGGAVVVLPGGQPAVPHLLRAHFLAPRRKVRAAVPGAVEVRAAPRLAGDGLILQLPASGVAVARADALGGNFRELAVAQ
jgi:hypothetical protein